MMDDAVMENESTNLELIPDENLSSIQTVDSQTVRKHR